MASNRLFQNEYVIGMTLQFKQQGKDILSHAKADIQDLAKAGWAVGDAKSAFQSFDTTVAASAKNVKKNLKDAAEEGMGGFRQGLKDLKSELGKGSLFGSTIKTLAGGGAIMGLSMAAGEMANFTGKIADASDALRKGDASAGEAIGNMARQAPVLGPLITAFDNLRNVVTGERVALELTNKEAALTSAYYSKMVESVNLAKTAIQDFVVERRKALATMAQAQTDDPLAKNVLGLREAQTSQWEADQKAIDERIKAQQKVNAERLNIQKQTVETLIQQFKNSYAISPEQMTANRAKYANNPDALAKYYGGDEVQGELNAIASAQQRITTLIREGNAQIEAIRKAGNEAALAGEAAFSAQILGAQRDAGQKLRESNLKFLQETIKKAREEFATAGKQLEAAATTAQKAWSGFFGGVAKNAAAWRVELEKAGQKVREALATPEQKRDTAMGTLDKLKGNGVVSPADYAGEQQRITEQYYQDKAAEVAKADEFNVQMAQGVEQTKARLKAAYHQDALALQAANALKGMSNDEFAARMMLREREYQEALTGIDQEETDKRTLTVDRFWAEAAEGTAKEVAQAQLQYDQDVANYRKALAEKYLTKTQYDGLAVEAQQKLVQRLNELEEQKKQPTPTEGIEGAGAGAGAALEDFGRQASASAGAYKITSDGLNGITDAFTDIIMGAKSAGEAFREFALMMIRDIVNVITKMLIWKTISSALGIADPGAGAGLNTGGTVQAKNMGGIVEAVRRFAVGGFVSGDVGGPDRDSVPALLTPGEFVVRRAAVLRPGVLDLLDGINRGMTVMHRSMGGLTPGAGAAAPLAAMAGGGGGRTVPQPVGIMTVTPAVSRQIMGGDGGNVLIDLIRQNSTKINAVLGGRR
jgi:hypothetical protein